MFLFRLRVDPAATNRVAVGQNSYAPGEYFFLTSDDIDKYVSRKLKDSGLVYVDREATAPEYAAYTTTSVNDVDDAKRKYYLEKWNLKEFPIGGAEGDILYYDGTSWVGLAAGTTGQVLTTQGVGSPPTWGVPTVVPVTVDTTTGNVSAAGGTATITLIPGLLTSPTYTMSALYISNIIGNAITVDIHVEQSPGDGLLASNKRDSKVYTGAETFGGVISEIESATKTFIVITNNTGGVIAFGINMILYKDVSYTIVAT